MLYLEAVAYWYFRLNGYLTIQNFVVHPDSGTDQETDIDVIAARFPFRAENLRRPMLDDPALLGHTRRRPRVNRIHLVFAEVKSGQCALNGPWTRADRQNMQRTLAAVGAFPCDMLNPVASALYEFGVFRDAQYKVSLVCLGARQDQRVQDRYPDVPQILWTHVADFIFDRFTKYRRQKLSHPQWDSTGQKLWDVAEECSNNMDFRHVLSGLLPPGTFGATAVS